MNIGEVVKVGKFEGEVVGMNDFRVALKLESGKVVEVPRGQTAPAPKREPEPKREPRPEPIRETVSPEPTEELAKPHVPPPSGPGRGRGVPQKD